jgi:hypothetical protein
MENSDTEQLFFELVNKYPSPHNGQPIRLKRIDSATFDIYFDTSRGLQSTEISYLFSFVSIGVFIEYIETCGKALGHIITSSTSLPSVENLKGDGLLKVGSFSIQWNSAQADVSHQAALQFRQTSRKKYYEGIPDDVAQSVIAIAAEKYMKVYKLNKEQTKQAIWLNQRAVFDDILDENVRNELNHWLRYSKKQKEQTMDGLAYDCMELNGSAMKFIIKHPKILKSKLVSSMLKKYYLRTMTDNSDVMFMLAPFNAEEASYNVGRVVMKIWHQLSLRGLYLHPFGTIMSNSSAHKDFLEMAMITDETRDQSYLVFIFRGGKSEPPTKSLRLPYQNHLFVTE